MIELSMFLFKKCTCGFVTIDKKKPAPMCPKCKALRPVKASN